MATGRIEAGITIGKNKYDIKLRIIQFIEDGFTIVYSPALDMSGYGKSAQEAEKSFQITLEEFFYILIIKIHFQMSCMSWGGKAERKKDLLHRWIVILPETTLPIQI